MSGLLAVRYINEPTIPQNRVWSTGIPKGSHPVLNYPPLVYPQGTMAGVDVDTLTMEQYLALSRENQAPGVDLLKKAFIQRYCPPSMTTKQLEDIHNFKQEGDESLYQAWERYNDLLYKCPTHDINSHQKGPIPEMRPTKALISIQTMADHSQKWHDGTTSKNIGSNSSKDGLVALVNKLDNLGRDMKKLKESVHAITYFLHVKMVK
ncbi:hypothetical protein Tco_0226088 [Tanacetum coccineum]